VGEVLERSAGAKIARKYRELRAVPDAAALHRMLVEAGFEEVQVRSRAMVVRLRSIETFVIGQLSSSPMAGVIAEWSEERRNRFGTQVAEALRHHASGDEVAIPDEVHVRQGVPDATQLASRHATEFPLARRDSPVVP
jgi:hypothetical protein